jgi:hypothetical protein
VQTRAVPMSSRTRLARFRRLAANVVAAVLVLWWAALNVRVHVPGRRDTAIAQLRHLSAALDQGAAVQMQSWFPEGYVFTWALYGLASAQVAEALPTSDPRRAAALSGARDAVAHVLSEQARSTFVEGMEPPYGAFYASWSLYLRSVVLRASRPGDPPPFDVSEFRRDCDRLASALERSPTPFLHSYPGQAWPADTGVGVAALAICDAVLGVRYRPIITQWVREVRLRRDPHTGAIPHAANADGSPRGGPRGESLALLSRVLADVDSSLAREQYTILRERFVDYAWGCPGVRVFPLGVNGQGDVDSGPVVLGFGGPATVVGAGAALANGDPRLGTTLLAVAEVAGFPIEFAGRRFYGGGIAPVGDAFLAWARSTPPAAREAGYNRVVPRGWMLPVHAGSTLVMLVLVRRLRRAGRARPAWEPLPVRPGSRPVR